MAGLFMCLGFPRGLLGFDLGIPWFRSGDSLVSILGVNLCFLCFLLSSIWDLSLLPAELHLGFHLEFLGFDFETPTRRQRQGLSQHL